MWRIFSELSLLKNLADVRFDLNLSLIDGFKWNFKEPEKLIKHPPGAARCCYGDTASPGPHGDASGGGGGCKQAAQAILERTPHRGDIQTPEGAQCVSVTH